MAVALAADESMALFTAAHNLLTLTLATSGEQQGVDFP
jgi:hypothetical protein